MTVAGLPDGRVPVVLSAHADDLIRADAEAILRHLDRRPEVQAVAATVLRTRRLRRHRAVVRAADTAELADGLRAVIAGTEHALVTYARESGFTRTAFVFPGQGNQWPSMGADAYRRSAVYRSHVDRCAEAFVVAGERSPLPYLIARSADGDWPQVQIQGAQFAHAVGLAHVWRWGGITPDVTVGHSLGEVAAAYVAGRMALPDAAAVVIARATAVERLQGGYGMAALGVSSTDAERLIADVPGWLEVSAVNASTSVVVSGERDAIAALVSRAARDGLFARHLDVDYPGHTSALEPLRTDLAALLPDGEFTDSAVEFVGSTTGAPVPAGTGFGDYWYRNLRDTVRFDRAVTAARGHGVGRYIEMSAHPALLFALGDLLGDDGCVVVGSGHRDVALVDAVSANITATAAGDAGYRWTDIVDTTRPPLRGFPNAPMRAVHLWADPTPLPPVYGLTVATENWRATTELTTSGAVRRIAVVDLVGPGSALADRLRAALHRHRAVEAPAPGEADLLVAVAPVLDHPDVERSAREISELVGAGLLGYVDAAGPACRAICLVTVGGEHVRTDEPVALPAQAALAAMHRSLGFERPDQVFRHLDLPSWEPGDAVVAAAVDALLGDTHEAAVRDSASQADTFVRTVGDCVEPAPVWSLDTGVLDNVVITGGSGAVGLHFARHLAAHGARRLVLLSRGGVAPAAMAELTSAGVDVVAPPCDITCAEDVAAAARDHGGDGASLLIHAAGAATFADRDALTAEAFGHTTAAKIGGMARMAELWPMRPDTRILLCSSISGVWGGRGHAAYSAANRMLDVMAGQLRAEGLNCVALRYGLWRGTGIADADEVARIERSGLQPMEPDAAVAASLRDHAHDPLLLAADHDRLQVFLDSQSAASPTSVDAAPADTGGDTAARVRADLAAVLNLQPASIDLETPLLDLGVDSLLALDLRKRLHRTTGHKVPLATLLGGITGGALIASLDSTTRSTEGKHT
ncbi:mycobactin polyketide synthase MbtD [Mycobacterium sp. B14F4]|uniref:mycobactin polyketide synthase MbtD n=1 Tax=Mycobacterium sp. B14F4 TaxID=3153565 RepID=UPI00325D2464